MLEGISVGEVDVVVQKGALEEPLEGVVQKRLAEAERVTKASEILAEGVVFCLLEVEAHVMKRMILVSDLLKGSVSSGLLGKEYLQEGAD